jgi:hypothetical protein
MAFDVPAHGALEPILWRAVRRRNHLDLPARALMVRSIAVCQTLAHFYAMQRFLLPLASFFPADYADSRKTAARSEIRRASMNTHRCFGLLSIDDRIARNVP